MNEPKYTVFLVDDDDDYLFQMRFQLEKWGYKVITADSQREAEAILGTINPDLAILDLMMENDDSGFTLCYKLKKILPTLPVVISTGVAAETGMSFGLQSEEDKKWIKADLYLEKGIRMEQFKIEIDKLLK